jgi:hypothetical protein
MHRQGRFLLPCPSQFTAAVDWPHVDCSLPHADLYRMCRRVDPWINAGSGRKWGESDQRTEKWWKVIQCMPVPETAKPFQRLPAWRNGGWRSPGWLELGWDPWNSPHFVPRPALEYIFGRPVECTNNVIVEGMGTAKAAGSSMSFVRGYQSCTSGIARKRTCSWQGSVEQWWRRTGMRKSQAVAFLHLIQGSKFVSSSIGDSQGMQSFTIHLHRRRSGRSKVFWKKC